MTAREEAIRAHRTLLTGGKLSYFEERGISPETVRVAWVGYDAASGAFTYPCIARGGGLLGIHYKSEGRDEKGKRRQWWGAYADDLPPKGHGNKPDDPAKVIPFGRETLGDLEPGTLVVLCCGEEDALSVRQAGYVAVSQPGAGLLEPAHARALAGLEAVVFYDAGEEAEAREDALKLLEAGAKGARVVEWPKGVPHGSDINGNLVEDPEGFGGWLEEMIAAAKPPAFAAAATAGREGDPDAYVPIIPETPAWPMLDEEAFCGLPGEIVGAIEPHTEADPVAVLASLLAAFGNAIGRGAFFKVGADIHHLKLNIGLVGDTSKGRKGMSWGHVRELMHATDERWTTERVLHGLSSGEGLIYAVRNRVEGENDKPLSGADAASILDLVWAQTDEEVEAEEVRLPEEIPEWAGLEGDMAEWDGWTVSLVRECISAIASVAEQGEEQLIEVAIGRARLDVISAKAAAERVEQDLGRMSRERLLPDDKTLEKVARYEAHLSRLFHKALHELEALQVRRAGGSTPLARLDVDGLAGS